MSKVLFAVNNYFFSSLFSEQDLTRVRSMCDFAVEYAPPEVDKDYLLANIEDADIVVTSWGTPALDADVMSRAKRLRLLTHAAGSVKPVVSDALWDAQVRVTSAAAAIAYGVAEYCLGLILTATKRAFWASNGTSVGQWQESLKLYGGLSEIYQQKIGIIGASHVGRQLVHLLSNFTCDVLLYDPYCSDADAERLGVTKIATMEELFSQCKVVSLNAPYTEETKGMLRGSHFALLSDGAVFINTARNQIINEPEFIGELREGRFVACIDVTDPQEPCPLDHPYRTLPNVVLTPHIAGAVAENQRRMGTFAVNEIEAYLTGRPLIYEVTREQLTRIG